MSVVLLIKYPGADNLIRIDGTFDDWIDITSHHDSANDQENENINLIEYRVDNDDDDISVYMEVEGEILKGTEQDDRTGNDIIHVFIDSDNDETTGYDVDGLGADYMLEISGNNGEATYAMKKEFNSGRDANDWNGWDSVTRIKAETNGNKLEITSEHPVYVKNKGWVDAGELTIDDELLEIK